MDEQIPISLERVEQPFGLVSMTERGSEAWLGLAFDDPQPQGPEGFAALGNALGGDGCGRHGGSRLGVTLEETHFDDRGKCLGALVCTDERGSVTGQAVPVCVALDRRWRRVKADVQARPSRGRSRRITIP